MKAAKSVSLSRFYLCGFDQQKTGEDYFLNQRKFLIGSADHCDIVLKDSKISHYHAYLYVDVDGIKITDLDSLNGTYLNGQKVGNSFLTEGDVLSLADKKFFIENRPVDPSFLSDDIIDQDEKVENHDLSHLLRAPILPPRNDLFIVDDEYCDIYFKEDDYMPDNLLPFQKVQYTTEEFVEFDENSHYNPPDLVREANKEAFEVISLIGESVLTTEYIPIKKRAKYYAGRVVDQKNTLYFPFFDEEEKTPFLSIKDFKAQIIIPEKATSIYEGDEIHLNYRPGERFKLGARPIFINIGKNQIHIRKVKVPPKLKIHPFFDLEKAFWMELGKVMGLLGIITLGLLLIDTTIPEPEKKVTVIYRKKAQDETVSNNKSKENPDATESDQGIQKEEVSQEAPEDAQKQMVVENEKQQTPKPQQNLAPTIEKKKKSQPTKKISNSKPRPKNLKKKPKFNFKSKIGSLRKKIVINKTFSSSSESLTSLNQVKALDQSQLKNAPTENFSNNRQGVRFGKGVTSKGMKGLSSKKGIETSYIDPKTIVLGSMDPELLRKILTEYLPQFRHCYQKELQGNEMAKGILDLRFRIMPDGKAQKIQVTATRAKFSAKGTRCMQKVLGLIKFPKPKGGGVVDIRQPLNFTSEKGSY